MGHGGIVALLGGSCRDGSGGEVQLHAASANLILQFQNNTLSDLLAHTLGSGKHLLVAGHYGEGEVLRSAGGKNCHGCLGTNAVDRGQQFIAPLLFPADKAVKVEGVFPDGLGDKKLCFFCQDR